MKVLNFGSLNIDYVYTVDHMVMAGETLASSNMNVFCGGKGLNQSIALARAGVQVFHAGMVGPEGGPLLDACRESGVDTRFIRTIQEKSGHTIIQVDRSGQNCILLYGGANRAITQDFADEVLDNFEAGDTILLQNEISCLDAIIERAYEKQMTIVLNPSPYDGNLDVCDLHKVSLFLLNEIEGQQLTGEQEPEAILSRVREMYPQAQVVLTLGGESSVYQDQQGRQCRQTIYPVKVLDTTAAGDTFTGYFLAAVVSGISAADGLAMAAKAAAIAVSRKGAAASIPRREEVLRAALQH